MKKIYLLIAAAVVMSSCNYLDVDPVGQVIPHTVTDYRAMLTSAYQYYPNHKNKLMWTTDEVGDILLANESYNKSILNATWRYTDLLAHEFEYLSFYKAIFYANEVSSKIMDATNDVVSSDQVVLAQEDRRQILAEACALRAYCYFDLLNMYAKWYDIATAATDKGVPVTIDIDIKQEFPRATIAQGYQRILDDIQTAKDNLQVDVQPTNYKYRFSKLALMAFEARVRLYRGEFDQAYTLAKEAIALAESNGVALVDMVADGAAKPYAATSTECILALERPFQPTTYDLDETFVSADFVALYDATNDKRYNKSVSGARTGYVKAAEAGYGTIYIEAFGFEMPITIETNRCIKEKERVSFRLSELYLTAAEAALKMEGASVEDARTLLGALQAKRFTQLPELSTKDASQMITEVANERARELVYEGHRLFDLKRTTRPLLKKDIIVSVGFDMDNFMATPVTREYKMISEDQYILPFPRSAQDSNPHLRR